MMLRSGIARQRGGTEHDPEKWVPVFGKDHAPAISQSGMTIRRKVIPLWFAIIGDDPADVIARSPQGDEAIQEPQSLRPLLWIASLRSQ
jgi:hypothetical protein